MTPKPKRSAKREYIVSVGVDSHKRTLTEAVQIAKEELFAGREVEIYKLVPVKRGRKK